ncbi:SRPBCC family protein [Paenibacillus protaetiae]|nr:SRPBCC domain-containing protein [Paenibacillus protaetiae]
MAKPLVVQVEIGIDAPASKVWSVLVKPEYIKQWDEVPDDFTEASLQLGTEMVWHLEHDEYTKLTVTAFDPEKMLRTSLYVSAWEEAGELNEDDIGYTYTLTELDGGTLLNISIGDFAKLASEGQPYYEATIGFAQEAAHTIKQLAEQ